MKSSNGFVCTVPSSKLVTFTGRPPSNSIVRDAGWSGVKARALVFFHISAGYSTVGDKHARAETHSRRETEKAALDKRWCLVWR